MSFLFYQRTGGPHTWECALASERANLIKEKVEFITVFDMSNSFTEPLSPEELAAVKYTAPLGFYTDFDGDIEEVLNQARVYLLKLESQHGFDTTQARLWFTGGRGVHCEVPIECFVSKVPVGGVAGLPAIFKEIAMATYVDTLDLRIYNGGRTRQWRVPNVKRSNGLYKVQVTLDEFMTATVEDYTRICGAPREALPITPPTFNAKLGLLYTLAKEKVDGSIKRKKSKKTSSEQASRFQGEFPDSVKLLLQGEQVKEGIGWNNIAMQLASFALAIGKTEDQMVNDARVLIDTHEGDSSRYGSPAKRERELRNQYRYQDGNLTMDFSIGGIKSLFAKGSYTSDLDFGDFAAEAEADAAQPVDGEPVVGETLEAEDAAIAAAEEASRARVRVSMSKSGIAMRGEDGPVQISAAGMLNPTLLRGVTDGKVIGYEMDVFVDRRYHGRHLMTMSALTSKSNFQSWLSQFLAALSGPETVMPEIVNYLRLNTKKDTSMFVVSREGVDVVTPPTTPEMKEQFPTEVIFASNSQILSMTSTPYRFRGLYDPNGAFKTDLLSAPDLKDTEETREFFDNLWEINDTVTLAKLVGWFVACFMCQPIREAYKQFPSLQSWGMAGSGKSKSTELMGHMHYWRHDPKKLSATGSTFFPIMAAVTQSASIPVVFDEYKPREMTKHNKDLLTNIFRNNYEGGMIERGSLNKDAGSKEIMINSFYNVAPIGFIGEALESQTAIQERCVAIAFSKTGKQGRADHFDYVFARRRGGPISHLGKALAHAVLSMGVTPIADQVAKHKNVIRDKVGRTLSDDAERPLFNMAVLLSAHDLLKGVLHHVFGDRYDDVIEDFQQELLSRTDELITVTMSEAAKVLDALAALTREADLQYRLEKGVDYDVNQEEGHVTLKLKPCFAKYVKARRALGMECLYDNEDAFAAGLKAYPGMIDAKVQDPIRRTPFERIFRFSIKHMQHEGIDSFFDM